MRFFAVLLLPVIAALFATTASAAPRNDNRSNAVVLPTANIAQARGNTIDATTEPGDRTLFYPALSNVWYRWTSPTTSETTIDVLAFFDSTLALFEVGPGGTLSFIDFDDDGGDGLNSRLTFFAQAQKTYVLAVDCYRLTSRGNFTLRIEQDIGEIDDFIDAQLFEGSNFTAVGNTSTYDLEEGEPVHGPANLAADASAWIRWTSPVRYLVTLDTVGSRFDTILAVYTGDDLTSLTPVAFNDNKDVRTSTSELSFNSESGRTYFFAVSGRRGVQGTFRLNLSTQSRLPAATVASRSVTAFNGDPAIFSATTNSSGPAAFVWQRLARGTRTWVDLADGPDYANTAFPDLTVRSVTLANDGDRFRLAVTDLVGTNYSAPITLTVTEFRNIDTEILGGVGLDLTPTTTIPPPTNDGSYFAIGLPPGLEFDAQTGAISGIISSRARPGTYRVRYGSTDGRTRNPLQFILVINVAPFSPEMSGDFEAILNSSDAPGAPAAKLNLTINRAGRYTGRLFLFSDSRTRPIRGELVLDGVARTSAPGTSLLIPRQAPLAPLSLNFQLSEPDPLDPDSVSNLTATLLDGATPIASTSSGRQLLVFPRGATVEWAGTYNVILGEPFNLALADARPVPQGSGHGRATVAPRNGRLVFRGRLADHTPVTAAASPATENRYYLANRLYSPAGGSLAGTLILEQSDSSSPYLSRAGSPGSKLYWTKPAFPRSRGYREGFGPLELSISMASWVSPRNDLALRLGVPEANLSLLGDAPLLLGLRGAGVDNTDSSVRVLPLNLVLSQRGVITLGSNPPAALDAGLRLSVNSVTGQFTGRFLLIDPPTPPSIVPPPPRVATVTGSLIQDPTRSDDPMVVGAGYFLYPSSTPDGQSTQASGLIEILVEK